MVYLIKMGPGLEKDRDFHIDEIKEGKIIFEFISELDQIIKME